MICLLPTEVISSVLSIFSFPFKESSVLFFHRLLSWAVVVCDILLFVTTDVTFLYKIYCSSLPNSFILNVGTGFGCEPKGQGARSLHFARAES